MASSDGDTSSMEKKLFKCVQERNYDEVKWLITNEHISVDCVDADGMTPLQHAAYKGDHKQCKLLLDCGADVNLTRHTSRYSALTFAGLSGSVEVVLLLLEHGASPSSVNSINKTASQMSAFVGNHHVVGVINNFIPFEAVEYFTKVQGLEKEPKLPASLAKPVHKMAVMTNINPVRLALYIQENWALLENAKKVSRVFDILSEKQFKDCNELLSLKFHHLSYALTACEGFTREQLSKRAGTVDKIDLTHLIKAWLKGDENGFPVGLEKFLRKDIQQYPFIECSLFQQLIRTLAPMKIGEEPSAISIIGEAVSGQRGMEDSASCATCGNPRAEKKCSACKSVDYCNKACQKMHWFTHKSVCGSLSRSQGTSKEEKEGSETVSDMSEKMPPGPCEETNCDIES